MEREHLFWQCEHSFWNMWKSVHIQPESLFTFRQSRCSLSIRTSVHFGAEYALYDNFPQHALSLKLTTMFIKAKYVIPHYYCSIRERYLEQKSPGWASKKNDLRVGNLTLDLTSDDFLNKWANRGDAAFLSYLIEI